MVDKHYVGKGWSGKFGVNYAINKEEMMKLPVDSYGCWHICTAPRKVQDVKSKATHYAYEDEYQTNKILTAAGEQPAAGTAEGVDANGDPINF